MNTIELLKLLAILILPILIISNFIISKRKVKSKKIEVKQIQEIEDKKVTYASSQIEEIQREFSTNKYNPEQIENILLLVNKKVPFELIKLVLDPNIDSFMVFEIYYNYDDLQLIGVKEILSQLEKGIYDSGHKFKNKAKLFIANKKLEDLKNSISKNIN